MLGGARKLPDKLLEFVDKDILLHLLQRIQLKSH